MIFKTKNKNHYLYSPSVNQVAALHPVLYYILQLKNRGIDIKDRLKKEKGTKIHIKDYGNASGSEIEYHYQTYLLLEENNYFENRDAAPFTSGRLTPELVESGLYGNRHIIFEVTDACNLKCKYCTYGEYYDNFEKRENRNLSPEKARRLIDYMVNSWNSDTNKSEKTEIRLAFYGGEPLLNVPFIKKIIQYTKEINLLHNYFTYGMTTNGVLLDRHMDFLVENKFDIMISLDGNEKHNGYRVFPDGQPAYKRVYENIMRLKTRYPDYFEKYVSFNSVLHRLNSAERIYDFFMTHFNKKPGFSEVDPTGIKESKKEAYLRTYKGLTHSLKGSKKRLEIEKQMTGTTPGTLQLVNFLHAYSGWVFKDYDDLTETNQTKRYIPTGTCMPLNRKIFLAVSGKIYPCERVGFFHDLGYVTEEKVVMDFKKIAKKYNDFYDKLAGQCKRCSRVKRCPACILKMEFKNNSDRCPFFKGEMELKQMFSRAMTYLENNPGLYSKIMEEVVLE